MGTFHLLDLCVEKAARGFVLMSSAEVYGAQAPGDRAHRRAELRRLRHPQPACVLRRGKRAAETICATYRAQHGIESRVVRFGHVYGPGMALDDGRVQADFAANVVTGKDIVLNSDGSGVRTYTYVADAVAGMFYALLRGDEVAYNVADPDGWCRSGGWRSCSP
nr:NAD-dependent epimerase/dehydratase family protein [Streptomyces sp. SID7803]